MVKVMNYVYAAGIYVIINAALYASNYMEGSSVHGTSFRPEDTGFQGYTRTAEIGKGFGSVHRGGGAIGLSRTGEGGGSRM